MVALDGLLEQELYSISRAIRFDPQDGHQLMQRDYRFFQDSFDTMK